MDTHSSFDRTKTYSTFEKDKEEEKRMPLSWAAAQKIKQKLRKAAKIKINILKEVNTFHYKAEDNCVLAKHINGVVFKKAGQYIFALGLAQFCCHISLFLCIKSICAY